MPCAVEGCGRPTVHRSGKSLGARYCAKHTWRAWKYGDPLIRHKTGPKPKDNPDKLIRIDKTIAEQARANGIEPKVAWDRLADGWPMEQAVSWPVGSQFKTGTWVHGRRSVRNHSPGGVNPDLFIPKLPWE